MDGTERIYLAKAIAYFAAAFAMSVGTIGPALGQGMIGKQACESIGKYPESASDIRFAMMMAMGFVESSAVYNLMVAMLIIFFFG